MNLVGAGVLLMLLGGVSALLLSPYPRAAGRVFGLATGGGCAVTALAALQVLAGRMDGTWTLHPTLPGGVWILGLDGLSAWFLLPLSVAGGLTTMYGVRYMQRESAHRPVAWVHAAWSVLLAGMIGVLVAQSALLFLLTWEAMAVSAYFLIMAEYERAEVRRAGLVYLVLTHLGTLGLLVMFLSWGHSAGSFTFAGFAARSQVLPWAGTGILLLALFGFGIKAGVLPFHFWLPGAHSAAPSHVSALLSGVMLKMGIYGLLRVLVLVGTPPAWWGWTVLALGLASAVLGALWALAQRDIKRALAYSSVENVGLVLMGLGLGSLGATHRHPTVALLGYTAALLHALNHALIKSLLFLGAGAVVRESGTRELDRLGGLARRMPRTAVAFAIGSIAIVGLPPLNGFVGEWTLVQGFLTAGHSPGSLRWTCLGAAGIGLVGALALACFVRIVGTVFLGQPRDRLTHEATDADSSLTLPIGLLAAACASIGLAPGILIGLALPVAGGVAGIGEGTPATLSGPAARLGLLGALVLLVIAAAWMLRAALFGRARRRSGATWGCAYARPSARMQYTAASFGAPILSSFVMPTSVSRARPGGPSGSHAGDRIIQNVVRPAWNRIQALAHAVRPLQQGRVTTYLQYMIWTVLLLLGFLFASTGSQR